MVYKKLIPSIYIKDEKAYNSRECTTLISEKTPFEIAAAFSQNGADGLFLLNMSYDDASHEKGLGIIRQISKEIDIPLIAGGNIRRVEDVKKYLYAGASAALLEDRKDSNLMIMKEVTGRFGKNKLGLWYTGAQPQALNMASDNELSCIFLENSDEKSEYTSGFAGIPAFLDIKADIPGHLKKDCVMGVTGIAVSTPDFDFMAAKISLEKEGIPVNIFKSAIPAEEFKFDRDGLIPVIVQDYKTDEVLMLAHMNKESYQQTLKTGKMTYYSRSRQELWEKGATSGHFQYVRSIEIDCDRDTLLAKVKQIGAACHTGNQSCFYSNLISSADHAQKNPLKILQDIMNVIRDRKENPKEGSYTNYLFDKGIDKILKKLGEEATEIIIAAKNPGTEEIKYEISDFLYHAMVLMVLKGVSWEDIIKELANR